ncbi:ornithine carbamoyltransferase [Halorussus salilacus]|uniref:ornithine carbamoyltransferase n=1 Tax=Halorussus salilacus TaxID=2953750 RepID=UPI00209DC942|nr:ornithine carbamoyltransferase [Halorussus salilacus]USZ66867.1 ornithine carbamoyltransferase [Halorussus salilacus]
MSDYATRAATEPNADEPPAEQPTDSSAERPTDSPDGESVGHLLDVDDLSEDDLAEVFSTAAEFKEAHYAGESHAVLPNRTLAMLFEKPSTRTRVSFETGMTQLGGHAVFLGPENTHLDRGEPVSDTARVLSRYVDAVMARVFDHDALEAMAAHSSVPVVNGLSDDAHPCQTLADLFTIYEEFGGFEDVTAAWVGDGNNVARSFAVGCAMAGVDLAMATPEGYEPDDEVLARASERGEAPELTHDPEAAVEGADVVYTDVWVSMGEEDARTEKLADFEGFQVNADLLANAPDATVMHCLPAHRGEEITGEVLESERAAVWDQAENRMHTQKALLAHLLGAK